MKRSPLKRKKPFRNSASQMARKRIRPKRDRERPGQDRLARARYLEANPVCEFKALRVMDPPGGHDPGSLDPHHIARIRHDLPACLISLCRRCHDHGHSRDAEFVVHCLWAKLKKGELDIDLLNSLKRGARLETYLFRGAEFTSKKTASMAREILNVLENRSDKNA